MAARPRPDVTSPSPPGTGALTGVRVLDLSQWLAGPAAAALLGDFGAEVVMVERRPPGRRRSTARAVAASGSR
jgi:crotonobetainyl-CoA:carnitine CoA-transferase CaiB-like acyl-CoA transferase